MKKIIIILLFLCGILFSCSEKPNIVFHIEEDITIELDSYFSDYKFDEQVEVFMAEERISNEDLIFTFAEGSSASLGQQEIIVSYKSGKKEYQETFKVTFVDNYSNVLVYTLNDTKSYSLANGNNLNSLNLSYTISGYKFTGF
ncbi:MAG: hypothetical protein NC310_06990, partial [Roseburia sp.]|nr:hypothetical protein [Roseburia sp.]